MSTKTSTSSFVFDDDKTHSRHNFNKRATVKEKYLIGSYELKNHPDYSVFEWMITNHPYLLVYCLMDQICYYGDRYNCIGGSPNYKSDMPFTPLRNCISLPLKIKDIPDDFQSWHIGYHMTRNATKESLISIIEQGLNLTKGCHGTGIYVTGSFDLLYQVSRQNGTGWRDPNHNGVYTHQIGDRTVNYSIIFKVAIRPNTNKETHYEEKYCSFGNTYHLDDWDENYAEWIVKSKDNIRIMSINFHLC